MRARKSSVRGALRKAASLCVRHHGVSMSERAGCERGVEFVGRELRARGLGHITELENAKVRQAFWMARQTCDRMGGTKREACLKGLGVVQEELGFQGFSIGGRRP